jgi:formylglycine-generating enzyme required for sulfatase activity
MKYPLLMILLTSLYLPGFSQENQIKVSAKVIDAHTKEPLSNATVEIKARGLEMITSLDGSFAFDLPADRRDDSLTVSHIGYKPFAKRIGDLDHDEVIPLSDYTMELRAVTITSRNLSLKEVDTSLRSVRGNLYAYNTETTNGMYNLFLGYLEENGQEDLLLKCRYDLSGFDRETRSFFGEYTAPFKPPVNKKDTSVRDYTAFPAVSMSYEAAGLYCQWLTEQYNTHTGKKKFKKVKFRLPTLQEWQIAALGYPKFQSWNLLENTVEVVIPDDTTSATFKGKKQSVPVTMDFLYPWWSNYNYRNRPTNQKNCYLANFKAYPVTNPCEWGKLPSYDGWFKMAKTACYFPNNIGLYDMVGNVSEMISEKGRACGGSWNDIPEQATIHSVKTYKRPADTLGFRIFMEVIEK